MEKARLTNEIGNSIYLQFFSSRTITDSGGSMVGSRHSEPYTRSSPATITILTKVQPIVDYCSSVYNMLAWGGTITDFPYAVQQGYQLGLLHTLLACTTAISLTFIICRSLQLYSYVEAFQGKSRSTWRYSCTIPYVVCSKHLAIITIPVTTRDCNSLWHSIGPAHHNYRAI